MKKLSITLISLVLAASALAQDGRKKRKPGYPPVFEGATSQVYKRVGDVALQLWIFAPEGHRPADRRPAIVFFFGGGWKSGSPAQFEQHCRYLARRGMIAITADYRVASRHGVKAKSCLEDAKDAIRFVRSQAEVLGVDRKRIAAGGGSAGGHLAAATGTVAGFEELVAGDSVSSRPDAMALFNPACVLAEVDGKFPLDPERAGNLKERMGVDPKAMSPCHHVKKGAPPCIIFHGKADTTVKYWTAEAFAEKMTAAGNRCELVGFEGMPHGFFNYGKYENKPFTESMAKLDAFFVSLGWLE